MIQITPDGTAELRRRFAALVPDLQAKVLRAGAQRTHDVAQDGADSHTKTGALARSVRMGPIPGGYEIGHDRQMAPHALFVHWGTRAHDIPRRDRPRNKKVLRWPSGDGFAFAKFVHHPGYRGDPWMTRARDAAIATMLRIARETAP